MVFAATIVTLACERAGEDRAAGDPDSGAGAAERAEGPAAGAPDRPPPRQAPRDPAGPVFDSSGRFTFEPSTDPAERERIIQEIWETLTVPPCWDASFVGPSTPAGFAAAVSQYSFGGQFGYRYVGFDTYAGSIRLHDVGRYRGHPAAIVSTWDETEGIILVDRTRFEHVLTNPSGALFSVTFWSSDGPCL